MRRALLLGLFGGHIADTVRVHPSIERPWHSVLKPRGRCGWGVSVSLFVTSPAARRIQPKICRLKVHGKVHRRRSSDNSRRVNGQ